MTPLTTLLSVRPRVGLCCELSPHERRFLLAPLTALLFVRPCVRTSLSRAVCSFLSSTSLYSSCIRAQISSLYEESESSHRECRLSLPPAVLGERTHVMMSSPLVLVRLFGVSLWLLRTRLVDGHCSNLCDGYKSVFPLTREAMFGSVNVQRFFRRCDCAAASGSLWYLIMLFRGLAGACKEGRLEDEGLPAPSDKVLAKIWKQVSEDHDGLTSRKTSCGRAQKS